MDHGQQCSFQRLLRNRSEHPQDACSPGLPHLPLPGGLAVRFPAPAPSVYGGAELGSLRSLHQDLREDRASQGTLDFQATDSTLGHLLWGKGTCGFSVKMQWGQPSAQKSLWHSAPCSLVWPWHVFLPVKCTLLPTRIRKLPKQPSFMLTCKVVLKTG